MTKTPSELMKEYVRSQKFSSTEEVMAAMKEMYRRIPFGVRLFCYADFGTIA